MPRVEGLREFLACSAATVLFPTTGWAVPAIRPKAGPVIARVLPEGEGSTGMLGFTGSSPGLERAMRMNRTDSYG